jgi:hypothetical protein
MTIHRNDAAPSPESDEQYVREVIDSAMAGTRPPVGLPSAALARGRRLRAWRRATVASVAVAAGVLAAATAPFVLGGGGSATTGEDLVATQPPAPEPAPPKTPSGWWDMPATDMVDAVRAILPDGVTVTDPGSLEADTPEGGPGKGWISPHLSGPAGPGSLNVMLYPDPARSITLSPDPGSEEGGDTVLAPSAGPGTGCDAPELSGATSCVDVQEGDEVAVQQAGADIDISCAVEFSGRTECVELHDEQGTVIGRRLSNLWGGTVLREVVLRRDGGTVYAASANTLDDKWGADSPVSADSPPLTLDDLENLVRNDVWVSYEP